MRVPCDITARQRRQALRSGLPLEALIALRLMPLRTVQRS